MNSQPKTIWIDLDNSPHVPFFRPIVDELRASGYSVVLTARDAFQVTDLTRLHQMQCVTIGRHYGKNSVMKVIGFLVRACQLMRHVARDRPALAVSHGSRSQVLAAKLLGIPSMVIADYEHVTHVNRPDYMVVPDVIPADVAGRLANRVLTYPGIKEDVYAGTFEPDASIVDELGLDSDDVVVTVRPPATEAHYHNPESEILLDAVVDLLTTNARTRVVLLPRNDKQAASIAQRWPQWFANGKMMIPRNAVDGLNLVWHSDLVISGGGTMNREAAALGVPVYSIFRGTIGAVDRYLANNGRLVLLTSVEDVRQKIELIKRNRRIKSQRPARAALFAIVDGIVGVIGPPLLPKSDSPESRGAL